MSSLRHFVESRKVYFAYPQYIWAKATNRLLKAGTIPQFRSRSFIDAPCGNGIISFWLKHWNPELRIQLYDIDKNSVAVASRWVANCEPRVGNLYELDFASHDYVWLLINSLYCLPEVHLLLARMRKHMGYVVGLFPYVGSKNYEAYMRRPGANNPCAMDKNQTMDLFASNGYELVSEKDLTHIAFLALRVENDRFAYWMRKMFNLLDSFAFASGPYYWLAVWKRRA